MREKTKKFMRAGALLVAAFVLVQTVLSEIPENTFAQQSFNGIDSLIQSHNEDDPFTIVELVPDLSYAKLGFLVGGSEPFYYDATTGETQSFTEHLALLTSPADRTKFSSDMAAKLSAIISKNASDEEPLSYAEYGESYVRHEGDTELKLDQEETIKKDQNNHNDSYHMEDSTNGAYNRITEYVLAQKDENGNFKGDFDEEVSYYSTGEDNKYYNLTFVAADPSNLGSDAVYKVKEAIYLKDINNDNIDQVTDFTDLYCSTDNKTYIKVEKSNADTLKTNDTNNENKFYLVYFEKTTVASAETQNQTSEPAGASEEAEDDDEEVVEESIIEEKQSTAGETTEEEQPTAEENNNQEKSEGEASEEETSEVDTSKTSDAASRSGSVVAAVPRANTSSLTNLGQDTSGTTYYKVSGVEFVPDKTGTYGAVLDAQNPYTSATNGHFTSETTYQYVGEGKGAYNLVEGAGTLDADVVISSVYYHGGFTNNGLFKKYVFNGADVAISVVPMTPAQFTSYTGDVDLLYISDSSSFASATKNYSGSNDLSALQAVDIYTKVVSEGTYLPVILDYGILQETNIANTNIYKLAQLLTAEYLSQDNFTLTTGADNSFSITVADVTAFSDPDKDNHYVNDNVYVVPKESADFSILNDFGSLFLNDANATSDKFVEDAKKIGFGDVAEMITGENFFREIENNAQTGTTYELFDQTISKAISIEFIISYATRRENSSNRSLTVLDIEPCAVTDDTKAKIETEIKSLLGIESESEYAVNVVHMTSAEFISKVEDLCKYDMIYMGLYTDRMNVINGRTVYNDSDMNGLVYTNTGDYQYAATAIGTLDTDYWDYVNRYYLKGADASKDSYNNSNRVRYSGNDFTTEKVKNIEDFIKSGSPVVLANNFLTTGADGKTYVYDYKYDGNGNRIESSNGYIDNCSNVYQLVQDIKDSANVMTVSSVTGAKKELLFKYATMGKPELTVDAGAKTAGQNYVTISGRTVSFDFTVKNYGSADTNATFNCILYADYNADGRYSNTTEKVGANDFRITKNGVSQTVKSDTDEDGVYYYYELAANNDGSSYHVEYDLSENYIGVLPIKIKVSQSNNDYRYAYEELYFYKANTTGTKQTVKVLQILPIAYSSDYQSDAWPTDQSYEYIFDMDLTGSYETGTDIDPDKYKDCPAAVKRSAEAWNQAIDNFMNVNPFYQLVNSIDDFALDIDSLYANHYVEFLKNPEEHNNFSLDDYDMLVIGFADSYTMFSEDNDDAKLGATSIQDFIKSGKSVLFTHDTTTYNDTYAMGRVMNKYLCPYVGLDRYGIYSSDLLGYLRRAGIWQITKDSSTPIKVSDYYSLKQAKAAGLLDKDTYTESELYDLIVAYAETDQKDVSYKPNSNFQIIDSSVQGRSSMTINNSAQLTYQNTNIKPGYLPNTHTAELVNEGQILIYPYNILDEMNDGYMSITKTHGQYYQIDMNEDADADGQSDVTVWLSLADDYRTDQKYDLAQKDARNNYYIYTKGNVTYSGVGHTNCNYVGNDTEVKLYINTMITAYNAGAHAPSVSLKQEDGTELSTIYVGMDSKISESGVVDDGTQIDQGAETVYFSIKDTNVTRGGTKKISVDYYLVYGDAIPAGVAAADVVNIGTTDNPVYAKKCDWETHRSNGTVQDSTNITSGVTYSVDIPYDIVNETENGRALIYVMATTSLWREDADPATAKPSGTYSSYNDLYVQRLGLFDLD